jgi:uncharacterized protein YyaL (SSP411 family)
VKPRAAALAALMSLAATRCGAPPLGVPEVSPAERPRLPTKAELAQLPKDGGPNWNRLVFEKSPYLLQHAANPVDWYPWGPEAFETAKRLDRPIFLSIGYATCHWCHVMEHESFEDADVAKLMNEAFVCVKVDREERPDVDHVYMAVTLGMTGSGGWPMTIVMTPDARPFFAGTYFPKQGRYGRPGMTELIPLLSEAWKDQRDHVVSEAARITASLDQIVGASAGDAPGLEAMRTADAQLEARFDARRGGFGQAPKFPTPHQLSFLLRWHARTGDEHALAMVEATLDAMRSGGIYDQVGFGLHRYSTDADWLVPHFEKMLYDQALLVIACSETHAVTHDERFADMAREIIDYVERDLAAPSGAFYSAEDADSEGEEGRFYVWTMDEMKEVLGPDADLAARVYGVKPEGNYRDEVSRGKTGANILHLPEPLDEVAKDLDIAEPILRGKIESARTRLLEARSQRVRPLRDDKILTDWNGLMIAALCIASRSLDEPKHAEAAARAADVMLRDLVDGSGRLHKRMRDGEAGLPAVLDDHAFLAWGLVELYETTFDPRWLEAALRITKTMIEHHADPAGGFFLGADDGEKLIVRGKEVQDGALPSGNSVAALVLLKLARITGDASFEDRAQGVFRAFGGNVAQGPSAYCELLCALDLALGPSHEVVVVGDPSAADTKAMLGALRSRFMPRVTVLLRPPGDAPPIATLAPFTATMRATDGKATAYACRNQACDAPTTDVAALLASLEDRAKPRH